MARTHLWTGIAAAMFGIAGILAANATENAPADQSIERSFTAQTVELRNLNASLRVETHSGNTVKLVATGPEKEIAQLKTTSAGKSLVIEAPLQPRFGGISNFVHVENNVVINRGGNSTVIIGGIPGHSATAPENTAGPIDIHLTLPKTAALSIRGFTGNAAIGEMTAPVELEMLSGAASFQGLASTILSIAGGARIEIGRAEGDLDLTVDGSGEVLIHDAAIHSFSLETNGTAMVTVNGRVAAAEMSLNGIADIHIAHLDAEPLIDANGIVTIDVGNR